MSQESQVLSVYEGFFNGGARILHTDTVIGLQELGQDQAAYSINETVSRERTVQSMYEDRSYRALAAAGIEVTTMGRRQDGAHHAEGFSELEVRHFKQAAAQADIILSLKEQPVDLISQAGLEGKPVIACLHRSDPEADMAALENLVEAVGAGVVAACICCADSTKEAYEAAGIQESKLHVITNGIDLEQFKPSAEARSKVRGEMGIPEDVPVVAFAARFDGIKNVPLFVESAGIYLQDCPDAHIIMCGAGMSPDNEELQLLINQSIGYDSAAARVHTLGIRNDMEAVYAASDVIALTSKREAYPLSLIEGMASGAVPVATDVGDVAAILEGRGLATGNNAEEIARAWQEAYDRRDEFRAGFEADPERFGRARMISNYAGLINRIYQLESGLDEQLVAAS